MKSTIISALLLGALAGATGCHHVHRDYHQWQRDDRRWERRDRDDRDDYRRRRWWQRDRYRDRY